MSAPTAVLTEAEKEHFRQRGFVHLKNCFSKEQAETITQNMWVRLGLDPSNKSTWPARVNMPNHKSFKAAEFAPKAWAAICELCGGEDRILPATSEWRDSLIVNLGDPNFEGIDVAPHDLDNWHVDGDFFVHYLDSPEQALLVIPMFTDVVPRGGGTMICPDAIPKIAKYLSDHPEGVSPSGVPRGHEQFEGGATLGWFKTVAKSCSDFVEVTGECGDVFLLHPLMLHSATKNPLRAVRVITNPPVGLREPFQFDRADGEYTLVEQATLRALGKDSLPGWKISEERERRVPLSASVKARMKEEETKRLQAAQA
ncbi:unnamed protein product [Clonostachys rosea]|uniref:Phytanoyl-CoA dioxygenase n=1 Tax=Bionectria ochroleuca TaxID=29856 RepID=A0ABY6U5P4_BIOOC|nr:unnamed protein product [Clonostachys rosea]